MPIAKKTRPMRPTLAPWYRGCGRSIEEPARAMCDAAVDKAISLHYAGFCCVVRTIGKGGLPNLRPRRPATFSLFRRGPPHPAMLDRGHSNGRGSNRGSALNALDEITLRRAGSGVHAHARLRQRRREPLVAD